MLELNILIIIQILVESSFIAIFRGFLKWKVRLAHLRLN